MFDNLSGDHPRLYTPAEVADILRLPAEWDRERWVRSRCKDGRIKAKCISRGVWRISEQALSEFLEAECTTSEGGSNMKPQPASLVDGLSARARRNRLQSG